MVGRLGSESLPDFLRMHWNSRNKFARKTELFKAIRNKIRDRRHVFNLLNEMDEDVDPYLALTQPEGSEWSSEWKQHARELRMFSVRQPYPMLMAAQRKLNAKDFGKLLRATVVLAFRYNMIGGLPPGDQERVYHKVALTISEGLDANLGVILDSLREIYVGDTAFQAAFAEKSIKTTASRNAKIVRYILCELEKQSSGHDFDIDSSASGIEHVLPQSPTSGWESFQDRDLDNFVYRLANMVMLEAGRSRTIGNKSYTEKRDVLKESVFPLTRSLAEENDTWDPERLEARQRRLAKLAKAVWRVERLS